jgi:serine/threonine-protein kinase
VDGTTQPPEGPTSTGPSGVTPARATRARAASGAVAGAPAVGRFQVQTFGKYLLDAEIARGGMARVYRARLRGLGGFEKTLVVKQILPELARDPRFVSMFVEEAKTLVAMSHPGIVPVFELGVVDGTYFLAMEYVDGATLSDVIAEGGPLPPGLVAQIGVATSEALQYAHERFGLVHRDVTPRNVMVDAGGHVRLLDFGIAAPVTGEGAGENFGSHGYMAPEQLRGERVSPRSDVFSLGCVLFEALCGRPAFFRGNAEQSRAALLEGPAPSLAEVPDLPAELRELVERAIERAPEHRFESAEAFGRRLRAWLAQAHPEGVTRALAERALRARSWREQQRHVPKPTPTPTEEAPRREPSGVVRTLAQSRALDALLTAPVEPPAAAGGEPVESTARLERARNAGAARSETTAELPTETAEQTAHLRSKVAAGPRQAAAPWWLLGFGVAMVGATGAVLWAAGLAGTSSRGGETTGDAPDGTASVGGGFGSATPGPAEAGTPAAADGSASGVVPASAMGGSGWAGPEDAVETAPADATAPRATAPSATAPSATAPDAAVPDAAARARPAFLTINAVPWAEVQVDGRSVGTTPRRNVAVTAGAVHVVELTCPPLGRSARITVRPAAGTTTRVLVDLGRDPPTVTVSP